MKKKESIMNEDHHLIRINGEENNAKVREEWKEKYKRIEREKKSKFWVWFYYWSDKFSRKKKTAIWTGPKLRRKSLEDELVEVDMNEWYISNGKVKK
jgi:hypothetical protein